MKCRQARIYLSPYLDSELDPTTTYEVSRHLESCTDCAQIFAGEEALERAIGERLRRPVGDEQQIIERGLSRVFPRGRRFVGWRAFFGAAALLAALGLFAYRTTASGSGRVPELIAMAAHDHHRYLLGELTPELVTRDPSDLAAFFAGQLAGGAMGSLPSGDGWELEGARVCHFHGVPVGFVTLRYHGIPVSVVDLPDTDTERARGRGSDLHSDGRCFELEGGRGILRRTPSGLRVAFGDLEMAKLEEVVRAAR